MGKEIRKLRILYAKDGHGNLTTRLSIPKSWLDKLGFSVDDREAEVSFDEEKNYNYKKNKAGLISCSFCYLKSLTVKYNKWT